MALEWPDVNIADAPIELIDGDRGKNYPKHFEFRDSGHCLFLNTGNVTASGFDFSHCQFITEEKDSILRKGKLERGDLIVTTRGTVGNVAYYGHRVPFDHVRINSGMVIFRADTNKIDSLFLYQFLRSKLFEEQVGALGTGSAQPQLPIRDINRIQIPVPPLREQKAIANILSALDDKIDLNGRMNETLEAIAQALFKSWFVDFDPVRVLSGQMPEKPPFLTAEAARKSGFPDRFQDSELGEIPAGWRVESLGDVVEFAYGKALKEQNRRAGCVPVFGSNGRVGWHDETLRKGPGIIVGRKGNAGTVVWAPTDFFAIDTTFYVLAKGSCRSLYFLFYALRAQDLASLGADSAVPGLNRNLAYMSKQVVPTPGLLDAFDRQVRPLFDHIHHNDEQSRTLASLRDTLLPKLLNGELSIAGEPWK
jgi:type I restriction enzyme S subunit